MANFEPIITVVTPNGERQITATVYGAWAAHRGLDRDIGKWCVTHVPSGLRLPVSQTELLLKAQAIEVARRINYELGARKPLGESARRVVEIIYDVFTGKAA